MGQPLTLAAVGKVSNLNFNKEKLCYIHHVRSYAVSFPFMFVAFVLEVKF